MIKYDCQFYSVYHDMGCVQDYCSNHGLGAVFDCEYCSAYIRKKETAHNYFTDIEKLGYECDDMKSHGYFCDSCYTGFTIDIEPVYCPHCGRKRL